jgi:hypothetical protein
MAKQTTFNFANLQIDKFIPMPERTKPASSWLAVIGKMDVGDSFVVPNDKVANCLYNYFMKLDMRCAVREIESGFYRVWRVK